MPAIMSLNTTSQFGEKGNVEYAWSNNIREKIIQLSFQLTKMPLP